jgi:transposase
MVREKYSVQLAQEERKQLQQLIRGGKSPARKTARARILLRTDEGWSAPKVAEALDVSVGTVFRTKRRLAEEGLEGALQERPRPQRPRKLDERGEAHLIALACSPAPEGHDHWTLRLLAGKVVELGLTSSMSHEGIRKRLKKTLSSPGRSRNGASLR